MAQAVDALIAGNWKMNGRRSDGISLAREIARRSRAGDAHCEILICPPATLLMAVAEAVADSAVRVGAQDCHVAPSGAHTGDISAAMLADAGCRYVIVGHSERRGGHAESDAIVRAKVEAAHGAGLAAIVCLGESDAQRQAGKALDVVSEQCRGSLPPSATAENTVIAYEPIWAIGTGKVAANADIAEVHQRLRQLASDLIRQGERARLLYGGSVKPTNAAEILAIENVNGALVGGASLVAEDFWAIVRSCP